MQQKTSARHKLQQRKFQLDIRKKFFNNGISEHFGTCGTEAVESPLEMLRNGVGYGPALPWKLVLF